MKRAPVKHIIRIQVAKIILAYQLGSKEQLVARLSFQWDSHVRLYTLYTAQVPGQGGNTEILPVLH